MSNDPTLSLIASLELLKEYTGPFGIETPAKAIDLCIAKVKEHNSSEIPVISQQEFANTEGCMKMLADAYHDFPGYWDGTIGMALSGPQLREHWERVYAVLKPHLKWEKDEIPDTIALRELVTDEIAKIRDADWSASDYAIEAVRILKPYLKRGISAPPGIQFSALWEYYKASEAYRNIQTALNHGQSIKPGQYEDTCNRYVMARAAISEDRSRGIS